MTRIPSSTRLAALMAAVAATSALSACAPILLGGALVGTSMLAIDRRSSGAQVDDQAIELRATRRINETIGDRGSVSTTSYNRIVLLTGAVTNDADRASVERVVSAIDGVKTIVNEITVGPASSFGNRTNDTLLTSKVKASMVDAKDIQANAYKVITERGTVYLMGRVTEREADRAAQIARGVSGVTRVVKVFEIVTEAELNDLQPKPAPPPPSNRP